MPTVCRILPSVLCMDFQHCCAGSQSKPCAHLLVALCPISSPSFAVAFPYFPASNRSVNPSVATKPKAPSPTSSVAPSPNSPLQPTTSQHPTSHLPKPQQPPSPTTLLLYHGSPYVFITGSESAPFVIQGAS